MPQSLNTSIGTKDTLPPTMGGGNSQGVASQQRSDAVSRSILASANAFNKEPTPEGEDELIGTKQDAHTLSQQLSSMAVVAPPSEKAAINHAAEQAEAAATHAEQALQAMAKQASDSGFSITAHPRPPMTKKRGNLVQNAFLTWQQEQSTLASGVAKEEEDLGKAGSTVVKGAVKFGKELGKAFKPPPLLPPIKISPIVWVAIGGVVLLMLRK